MRAVQIVSGRAVPLDRALPAARGHLRCALAELRDQAGHALLAGLEDVGFMRRLRHVD